MVMDQSQSGILSRIKNLKQIFFKKSSISAKSEIQLGKVKAAGIAFFLIFISIVLLLPDESTVQFSEQMDDKVSISQEAPVEESSPVRVKSSRATHVWDSPRSYAAIHNSPQNTNYNESTLIGFKNGNAKNQLRPGVKFPLRVLDKVIVSDLPVPVLAELLVDVRTDSGMRLPAGSRFYGEATFSKGSERAQVRFSQLSFPSGELKNISGFALAKDGQPGLHGRIFSDGLRNTTGQVITTFVGGLAAGSMETDFLGQSKGGLQNGLLSAVAATAKDRAQAYGEKMKAEREWIEISHGFECDAILDGPLSLHSEEALRE
jgi:hypothetical protein